MKFQKTKNKFNIIHEEERFYQERVNMLQMELNEKKNKIKNVSNKTTNNFFIKNFEKEQENNIKMLETFLNKKTVKYSSQKSSNNSLINEINQLRKEKDFYLKMHKKMESKLDKFNIDINNKKTEYIEMLNDKNIFKKKKFLMNHENINDFKNVRIGYQTINNEMRNILQKSKINHNNFNNNEEIKTIDKYKTLGKDSNENLEQKINHSIIVDVKNIYGNLGPKNKPPIVNPNNSNSILENEKYLEEKIIAYDNLFNDIKKICNKNNFIDIIEYYNNLKQNNDKLYNESQRLIEDLRHLKDIKISLNIQEIQIKETSKCKTSIKNTLIIDLNDKLEKMNDKIDFFNNKSKEMKQIVNLIKIGIPIILERINFKEDEINKISNKKLSDEETIYMLNLIESRTNEILKIIDEENLTEFKNQILNNNKFEEKLNNIKEETIYKEYEEIVNSLDPIKMNSANVNKKNHIKVKNQYLDQKNIISSLENIETNINKKNDQFFNREDLESLMNSEIKLAKKKKKNDKK